MSLAMAGLPAIFIVARPPTARPWVHVCWRSVASLFACHAVEWMSFHHNEIALPRLRLLDFPFLSHLQR